MTNRILVDPKAFREAFLTEKPSIEFDDTFGAVLRVLLFFIWRGCSLSRTAGLSGKVNPKAALISLSAYEANLGFIQNIRMGYHADSCILARALMERIAIVGHLGENRDLINRYWEGKLSPYQEALHWAKNKSIQNWMVLYGILSGILHSNIFGPAGHINNQTLIAKKYRDSESRVSNRGIGLYDVLLGLSVYALGALDSFALQLIQDTKTQPFLTTPIIELDLEINDTKEFHDFLLGLINRYGNIPGENANSPNNP